MMCLYCGRVGPADAFHEIARGVACKRHGRYVGYFKPSSWLPQEVVKNNVAPPDDGSGRDKLRGMQRRPLMLQVEDGVLEVRMPVYQPVEVRLLLSRGASFEDACQVYRLDPSFEGAIVREAWHYFPRRGAVVGRFP